MDEEYRDSRFKTQVIIDYIAGKISRRSASIKLHTSETYVSTLKKQYLCSGDKAFVHGNSGRTSSRKLPDDIEEDICRLYETVYFGFNFQHFCDYTHRSGELAACLRGYSLSDRGVARLLKRNGIMSPARHTGSRGVKQIHPIRPRRAQFGELVQVDASIHDWLSNGEKWAVYTAIDDATSLVLAAHIAKVESTEGYFRLLEKPVNTHGVPRTLYADRRTTFTFNGDKEVAKRAKIHFKRACDRLGIDIITTSTAQAKGRVERSFRALQDRFVKELRIQHIVNYHQAEDYLVKLFIPDHNKRCGKPPGSPASAFRPLTIAETTNLDIILACHRTRTILNGNVVSYNHAQYMPIDDNGDITLIPGGETVIVADNGVKIKLIYKNNVYETIKFKDGSTTTPPTNHPWRRWQSNKPNPRERGQKVTVYLQGTCQVTLVLTHIPIANPAQKTPNIYIAMSGCSRFAFIAKNLKRIAGC